MTKRKKAKPSWSQQFARSLRTLALRGSQVRAGELVFVCNICGTLNSADLAAITDREKPTCMKCRSSIRFRALIAALQERLFENIAPLVRLEPRKDLQGIGMSDEELYSKSLEEKFTYLNTFFHMEPHLDIACPNPGLLGRFDFVVCAEVMEHVPPPIQTAFGNLRSLLRPNGLLVLSVPFELEGETVEHFPDLYEHQILGKGEDRYLVNQTRNGEKEIFHHLIFHGGKGQTLEMRLFSRSDLLKLLETFGFIDIKVHSQSMPEWGIVNFSSKSVPITAIAGS